MIDLVVHYATWGITSFLFVLILFMTSDVSERQVTEAMSKSHWSGYLLGGIGALLYHAIAEGLNGATLGKRILGLAVINETGSPSTLGAGLVRSLAFYFDSLFFGLVAAAEMQAPYQQRFGDKWAKTYVVKRKSAQHVTTRVHFADAVVLGIAADATCYVVMAWVALWWA